MRNLKFVMVAVFALPMIALAFSGGSVPIGSPATQDDVAVMYKKNTCAACHGAKADKAFDTAKPDEEHIQIILKGKKAEKPPHMPGYEAKGMTAEQAGALVKYMRSLREAAQ
jgi:mono/diheme cytochrome c family protein